MSKPAFIQKQYEFAANIRDPEHQPTPAGIEERRMDIYRGLFYRNIEGFIASGFPVLRKLYNDTDWEKMVRNFMVHHQSSTPYFLEISEEFLKYLQNEHRQVAADPPFLLELAHYEWVELALTVSNNAIELSSVNPNGDLLEGHPVVSPLAWLLSYQWPVHQLGPDYQPGEPPAEPTHIIVFRDRTDKVRFVTVNPVAARLISLLEQDPDLTGRAALESIAQEMQHPKPETVIQGGLQIMEQLKSQGIILGAAL